MNILPALLILLLSPAWASASSEKGAAEVRELLELSGAQQQYQQLLAVMTRGIQSSFSAGLAKALKERPVKPAQRKQAKEILDRHFSRFIRQFQHKMKQTLTWERLVKDVYTPVYLKHFSPGELRDVIAFYRSPTGRKFAGKSGQLVQDASLAIKQAYGKRLQQQAKKLTRHTLKQIGKELDTLQQADISTATPRKTQRARRELEP